ncbi:hypothetical protein AXF42_Ash004233 [Apostasia shenzhenica]|uniref:DUF676 domain-containing protein n=1 Tax=Apostasia shenzhenica TaxID=1088818 RepID=A0A2I0A2B3_9ASPA|nr:hypothetical protein AXF42_Ash004233 [Apostasia shenzhenica]
MARAAAAAAGGEGIGADGRKRRTGPSSYLRRLNCFRPAGGRPAAATMDRREGTRRMPTHLVITVNGILGSADDWRFAAKQFVKRYPEDIIVHCSKCNIGNLTFDGVDVMGERLAKEVKSVVELRPELRRISFVCHSLGGLIARYAIGRLYEPSVIRDCSGEDGQCKIQKLDETSEHKSKGKIAGLEPVNFITFATPHLGSGFHKQIPIFRGSHAWEKMACRICGIAGRTGKHLFLKDHDQRKPPLLLQMITNCGDLKFMSGLRLFSRRVAYSNVNYDSIVGWKTSSIRHHHEHPKRHDFMKNEKYPHVVYVDKPKFIDVEQENFVEANIYDPKSAADIEDLMIKGLNRVPWERVDVSFRKSKQRIIAHTTIQVTSKVFNSDGADVIHHMIDNFLL